MSFLIQYMGPSDSVVTVWSCFPEIWLMRRNFKTYFILSGPVDTVEFSVPQVSGLCLSMVQIVYATIDLFGWKGRWGVGVGSPTLPGDEDLGNDYE